MCWYLFRFLCCYSSDTDQLQKFAACFSVMRISKEIEMDNGPSDDRKLYLFLPILKCLCLSHGHKECPIIPKTNQNWKIIPHSKIKYLNKKKLEREGIKELTAQDQLAKATYTFNIKKLFLPVFPLTPIQISIIKSRKFYPNPWFYTNSLKDLTNLRLGTIPFII